MKEFSGFLALCVALAMSAVSCEKSPQSQPQAQQSPPPQAAGPIAVKGFYIGMSEDEMRQVGKNSYGWTKESGNLTETTAVNEPDATDIIEYDYPATDSKASLNDLPAQFVFDSNHKLKKIYFGYCAVNNLFNASEMNADEFIQQFANSYHIPEFKHRLQPNGVSQWVYVSPDNVAITIFRDKTVSIRKVSPHDTKGAFN